MVDATTTVDIVYVQRHFAMCGVHVGRQGVSFLGAGIRTVGGVESSAKCMRLVSNKLKHRITNGYAA